ncbi:MAG: hypothetical protein H6567_03270 [Lewinellaceae bacterium]|nr:hypothetical protein [Lewinellaceae bacterium]
MIAALSRISLKRWVYILLGLVFIISSVMDGSYIWIIAGLYVMGMGIFGFGCAADSGCPTK